MSVNWVLSEGDFDLETEVALSFLDYLLAGTTAAPLRKAVSDSGLGESIVGGGVDDTLRQATYMMGLKGVQLDDVDKARPPAGGCLLCETAACARVVNMRISGRFSVTLCSTLMGFGGSQ